MPPFTGRRSTRETPGERTKGKKSRDARRGSSPSTSPAARGANGPTRRGLRPSASPSAKGANGPTRRHPRPSASPAAQGANGPTASAAQPDAERCRDFLRGTCRRLHCCFSHGATPTTAPRTPAAANAWRTKIVPGPFTADAIDWEHGSGLSVLYSEWLNGLSALSLKERTARPPFAPCHLQFCAFCAFTATSRLALLQHLHTHVLVSLETFSAAVCRSLATVYEEADIAAAELVKWNQVALRRLSSQQHKKMLAAAAGLAASSLASSGAASLLSPVPPSAVAVGPAVASVLSPVPPSAVAVGPAVASVLSPVPSSVAAVVASPRSARTAADAARLSMPLSPRKRPAKDDEEWEVRDAPDPQMDQRQGPRQRTEVNASLGAALPPPVPPLAHHDPPPTHHVDGDDRGGDRSCGDCMVDGANKHRLHSCEGDRGSLATCGDCVAHGQDGHAMRSMRDRHRLSCNRCSQSTTGDPTECHCSCGGWLSAQGSLLINVDAATSDAVSPSAVPRGGPTSPAVPRTRGSSWPCWLRPAGGRGMIPRALSPPFLFRCSPVSWVRSSLAASPPIGSNTSSTRTFPLRNKGRYASFCAAMMCSTMPCSRPRMPPSWHASLAPRSQSLVASSQVTAPVCNTQ